MTKTVSIVRGLLGVRGPLGEISDKSSLVDIDRAEPRFFSIKFGKRETYTMHRGQLIVRTTAQFTSGPERRTVVYLFLHKGFIDNPGKGSTYCLSSDCTSVAQAKRLIDKVWRDGTIEK